MTGLTLPSDRVADELPGELELSAETRQLATAIADEIDMHPVASRAAPTTTAAACIYLAGLLENDKRSQQLVGDAVGCSVGSIQRQFPRVARAIETTDVVQADLSSVYERDTDSAANSEGDWSGLLATVRGVFS